MADHRALRLRFRGHVQGVGFRAHVQFHCRAAGISGWVRNLEDGTVEAVMIGTANALGEAVRRIHAGRAHQIANVDQFEISVPEPISPDFEIRH